MSKMNKLAVMLTMAAMSGGSFIASGRDDELETSPFPKEPTIPKGCQKYVYKESFGTLEVIALNEKSALKKYNKWCAKKH